MTLSVTPEADGPSAIIELGGPVATLRFGLPGTPPPGWVGDDEDLFCGITDEVEARLRRFADLDDVSLVVSLDNRSDAPVPLPPVALAVTAAPGWVGWSWTADAEGFVALAPTDRDGPVVLISLARGFLRAEPDRSVFTDSVTPGQGLFHLLPPHGTVDAHRRLSTHLRVSIRPDLDSVAAGAPAWLPDLVQPDGTDLTLDTPDQGVSLGVSVTSVTVGTSAVVLGSPGHREVGVHGPRGVTRLRVTWVPRLEGWLGEVSSAWRSRRPSVCSSATGAVVAESVARGAAVDPEAAIDWLEREDWLLRGDLLGVAVAGVLAAHTLDETLLAAAWDALAERPVERGYGLVIMRLLLATLEAFPNLDPPVGELLAREASEAWAGLELALITRDDEEVTSPALRGVVHALGAGLPGQPLGLSAVDAARHVGLLRLCPESWALRTAAVRAAHKASGLLLGDYVEAALTDRAGLAWLLMGEATG